MSDETTAIREAAHSRLPDLEALNAELGARLQSLLSPAVVAALSAAPGATPPSFDVEPDLVIRATAIQQDLDARLPSLRHPRVIEGAR